MLPNISSHPRVRWRSLTNTQGLPLYRLSIMPSQNTSMPIPSPHFCIRWEVTHVVTIAQGTCCLPPDKNYNDLDSPPQGMYSGAGSAGGDFDFYSPCLTGAGRHIAGT